MAAEVAYPADDEEPKFEPVCEAHLGGWRSALPETGWTEVRPDRMEMLVIYDLPVVEDALGQESAEDGVYWHADRPLCYVCADEGTETYAKYIRPLTSRRLMVALCKEHFDTVGDAADTPVVKVAADDDLLRAQSLIQWIFQEGCKLPGLEEFDIGKMTKTIDRSEIMDIISLLYSYLHRRESVINSLKRKRGQHD